MPYGAVDVFYGPARLTHNVVVVVADATFVASRGARGLYSPDETGSSEVGKHVVNGLNGGAGKVRQQRAVQRIRVGVWPVLEHFEKSDATSSDPQSGRADVVVRLRGHTHRIPIIMND